jgi:thioredoxin-dependent peroxiredoxin
MKHLCTYLLFLLTLTSLTMISFSASQKTTPLQPGDPAPNITATDQDGKDLSFPKIYQKGITLVYFYPKAFTPGCTAEACSLRDSYQTLKDQQGNPIQIIGVSRDNADQQKSFQKEHQLPFALIADHDGKVATAFGVSTIPLLGLTSRQSFLIEKGKIV